MNIDQFTQLLVTALSAIIGGLSPVLVEIVRARKTGAPNIPDGLIVPTNYRHHIPIRWPRSGIWAGLTGVLAFGICTLLIHLPFTVETMDAQVEWSPYNRIETDARVQVQVVPGHANQALELSFSLPTDGWIGIAKPIIPEGWEHRQTIRFWYKGQGAMNSLELKVICAPNVLGQEPIFSKIWHHVTNTQGQWTQMEVAFTDLACWPETGCQTGELLEIKRIHRLDFAVSNKPGYGDQSGTGWIQLDQVQLLY